MTLTKTAYLEIERTNGTNATFELNLDLQPTSTLDKSYLMGSRGQYIRQIVNATPGTGTLDAERRTGYWIDGGAGEWQVSFQFSTGFEDVTWGDTSGGTGQSNVTETDASGPDVEPISRMQILQYWLATTKSDSAGAVLFHWGEWTNGNVSHVANFSAGAYGQPMPVAIQSSNLDGPDPDRDAATFSGTIEATHAALWGGAVAPDWADDAIGAVLNASGVIPDE